MTVSAVLRPSAGSDLCKRTVSLCDLSKVANGQTFLSSGTQTFLPVGRGDVSFLEEF